jgi:hypothetical protein
VVVGFGTGVGEAGEGAVGVWIAGVGVRTVSSVATGAVVAVGPTVATGTAGEDGFGTAQPTKPKVIATAVVEATFSIRLVDRTFIQSTLLSTRFGGSVLPVCSFYSGFVTAYPLNSE